MNKCIVVFSFLVLFNISCKNNFRQIVVNSNVYQQSEYGYSNIDKNVKLSINLPSNWTLEGTIFYNEKKEKKGELSPGIVVKEKSMSDLLGYIIEYHKNPESDELLSLTETVVGKYNVIKTIVKTPSFGGRDPIIWYPNKYYVDLNDDYFLFITFYCYEKNGSEENIYRNIISSIVLQK